MTTKQISQFIMRSFAGIVASVVLGLASSAYAADGTWTNLATGGLWSNPGNWSGGTIADYSGFTANFNTLNITADTTNRLDSARTLGNIIFGDTTTSSAANWILDNNGNAANILTLAGGTPTITVNALGTGKSASITAVLAGSAGLIKDGAGTLVLGAANTFTGGLAIKDGSVQLAGFPTAAGAGAIILGDTGGSTAATLILAASGGTVTYANSIVLGTTSGILTITQNDNALRNAVLSGAVTGSNNLRISGTGGTTNGKLLVNNLNNTGSITVGALASSAGVDLGLIGSNVTGLTQTSGTGTGRVALTGANPNFIGDTTLTLGTLNLQNINALQNSVLNMNGGLLTIGAGGASTITSVALGGLNGSVGINLNNNATVPAAVALTLGNSNASYAGNTLNPTYSGVLSNATAGASLTKVGINTQTLTGASTYTGATAVNGGTLDLGGSTGNGSLASTNLNLGGGTFNYTRTGGTQAFSNTTATVGLSKIMAAGGTTITLGALSNSGGTVDIGNTGIITTSTANNNGIIGGWATFNNGSTWAVANGVGSGITGLASYINDTWATGNNVDVTVNSSPGSGSTANSLRFNTAAANTFTLTGINTITTGGILVTPTVGANLSTITGGTLNGAASAYLNVVQNNTAGGLTIGSIIANNGGATGLAKAGAGLLTLTGINTYTGSTTIEGTLAIGGAGVLGSGTYATNIINNGAFVYSSFVAQTLSGVISGTGSVTKDTSSSSTLTLSGANTFTGGLFIKAGTNFLSSGNGTSTVGGSGSITIGDGGDTSATLSLGGGTSGTTYNNAIVLNGSSTAQLSIITGSISLSLLGGVSGTGNLRINDSRTGSGMTFNGASLNNIGAITNASSGTSQLTISSVIGSNVKELVQNGNTGSKLVITGANTNFIGDTTVTSGTLNLQNISSLQNSVLKMNGGSVTFGTSATVAITNVALGGLSGSGNINLTNTLTTTTAVNLTLGNSNDSYGGNTLNPTYSGVLSNFYGDASLTKVGSNIQTLSGANTYSGGTTISNGTLFVNNTSGSGTGFGAVSVATNGTLGGIGMITGTVTVANGGILSPGTNSVGTLTVGSLKLSTNAKFAIQIAGPGSNNYCVVSTGAVDIASSSLSLTVSPGYTPKFNSTFIIIRNVKGDAVTGTFANGATITVPGLAKPFEISTTGGAGNDVVLRYTGGGGTMIRFM